MSDFFKYIVLIQNKEILAKLSYLLSFHCSNREVAIVIINYDDMVDSSMDKRSQYESQEHTSPHLTSSELCITQEPVPAEHTNPRRS